MNECNHFLKEIRHQFCVPEKNTEGYSPLTLAYIGDAVYEIIIRTIIVEKKQGTVRSLHKYSSSLVNAKAQADILAAIESELSEHEFSIYKRGRNAKPHTVAKHADVHDYRVATGFEALMGYLYLSGNMERCLQLVKLGLETTSN